MKRHTRKSSRPLKHKTFKRSKRSHGHTRKHRGGRGYTTAATSSLLQSSPAPF